MRFEVYSLQGVEAIHQRVAPGEHNSSMSGRYLADQDRTCRCHAYEAGTLSTDLQKLTATFQQGWPYSAQHPGPSLDWNSCRSSPRPTFPPRVHQEELALTSELLTPAAVLVVIIGQMLALLVQLLLGSFQFSTFLNAAEQSSASNAATKWPLFSYIDSTISKLKWPQKGSNGQISTN